MIILEEPIIEKYEDGTLRYKDQMAIVPPMFNNLYPQSIIHNDGTIRIRIGEHKKFNKDASLQWELFWDEFGNNVKKEDYFKNHKNKVEEIINKFKEH